MFPTGCVEIEAGTIVAHAVEEISATLFVVTDAWPLLVFGCWTLRMPALHHADIIHNNITTQQINHAAYIYILYIRIDTYLSILKLIVFVPFV